MPAAGVICSLLMCLALCLFQNRKDFKNWFLEHRTQLIADKTLQLDALVPLPEKVKLFVGACQTTLPASRHVGLSLASY